MTVWHLDSLDARGGIAFASFREADLVGETLDMGALAVFVGAPDFRPETVASRATGLAAARGSLQIGLFLDGVEVGFETLDDLVEFVRRCFVAGGGGDGAAGIGPGIPPPTEGPEGPEGSPVPEKLARTEAWPIQHMLREFEHAARTLRLSKESEGDAAYLLATARDFGQPVRPILPDLGELLELGAVILVLELLGRCPSGTGDDLARWWQAVQCLGDAIGRLGLWHGFESPGADAAIERMGDALVRRRPSLLPPPEDWPLAQRPGQAGPDRSLGGAAAVSYLLRGGGGAWLALGMPYREHLPWYRCSMSEGRRERRRADEPFEDLARWPVPQGTAIRLERQGEHPSLADLLCTATGAPAALSPCDPADAALLLFAACHLTSDRGEAPGWTGPSDIALSWRNALIGEAMYWLRRQLPERVFPPALEAMIAKTSTAAYG